MSPLKKRTVSVDLPDALVRRAARHVGPHGGFGEVVERALELWLDSQDGKAGGPRPASGQDRPAPSSRQAV